MSSAYDRLVSGALSVLKMADVFTSQTLLLSPTNKEITPNGACWNETTMWACVSHLESTVSYLSLCDKYYKRINADNEQLALW